MHLDYIPPPQGSDDPSLCRGILVQSDMVWDLNVTKLFVCLHLQSWVSSSVNNITVVRAKTAVKAMQTEEEFVRCVVRGKT